jgi:hypothetical protein
MIISNEADRARFSEIVNTVELGKKRFIAEIKLYRKKRSKNQNNLFHMWLQCIADNTGDDIDSLKQYFKRKYLPWKTVPVLGGEDEVVQLFHTSDLDTKEMTDFMERVRMQMAGMAIILPLPEDQGYDQLIAQYGEK